MSTNFEVPMDDVIAWRRHLHAHPELSFEEHETSAYIESRLHEMGIETTRPTPTSVLGVIEGTAAAPEGRAVNCIALRADIDALPLQEETGEPFASTVDGVMHACGHDAHTAMLLGTAKVLMGLRDRFAGTVKLIFQHAEEKNPGGAIGMVEAGVLEGVDRVYGFHVMNGPKGHVQAPKGNATASAGGFFVTIQGVGSHGSMPHKGVDPVLCAAQLVVALNHIVSRSIDPAQFSVVNVGSIASGAAPNVIPDTAKVGCSIRTYSQEEADIAYRRCEEVVEGIGKAYGCTYEFDWVPPYDIVYNTPEIVDEALASARKALGEDVVSECPPTSASEDFSAFTNVKPGAFIFINAGDASDGLEFQNHHPKFNIVEDAMEAGVRTEVQIVLDTLGTLTRLARG